MISHKHKFIFIHIPKTAGTSLEQALRDETCRLLPDEWDHARVPHAPLNHLTLQELVDYGALTPAQLRSYFKFCFVRNPWDRLVSEIFCPWMSPWFKDLAVEQRIRRACELAATSIGIANHLRPQYDFVVADGLQMDFIGRFEQLEADFAQICRLLGIEAALPHLNRSAHRSYQEYYDAETQALAAAAYQHDIEAFHYTFGQTANGRAIVGATQPKLERRAAPLSRNRKIRVYPLTDQPAPLRPAAAAKETQVPTNGVMDFTSATRQGWQLCCPAAFTATWNGGLNAEDIEIHLAADLTGQPAFVQSNLGQGLLTFYPGYQVKTEDESLLWLRGPVNAPKDGLSPLEALIDASLLPCTVAIHWQFTRPHQTICFRAGEPFATLLLYPQTGLENVRIKAIQVDNDEDTYAQAFQQMIDDSALQSLFQRLAVPSKPSGQGLTLPGR